MKRLGVIGAGAMALNHAQVAAASGASVVAIAGRTVESASAQRFAATFPSAEACTSIGALLARDDLDGLVVCPIWSAMEAIVPQALDAGLPVLAEKPIALRAATARSYLAAGHAVSVGYNRRFYHTVAQLKRRVDDGGLKSVDVTISEDLAALAKRHGPEILRHVLAFSSAHTLDLVRYLFGELKVAEMREYREPKTAPFSSYNGMLIRLDGTPVFLHLNADDPSPAGLRCRFDDGTAWVLAPLERLTVYKGVEIIEATTAHPVRRYQPRTSALFDENMDFKPGFLAQMQAFLTQAPGTAATLQDAVATLDLIEAIQSFPRRIGNGYSNSRIAS